MRAMSRGAQGGGGRERRRPMVRPTTRKVFEAMFQILEGMLGGFEGLRVADVFAGSGQLGLEVLRRGAAEVTWFERDPGVVADLRGLLRSEPQWRNRVTVLRGDAVRSLEKVTAGFDLILMDPPYSQDLGAGCLEVVGRRGLLRAGGVCVVEHHHKDLLPERMGDLVLVRVREYGETQLSFYRAEPITGAGHVPPCEGEQVV